LVVSVTPGELDEPMDEDFCLEYIAAYERLLFVARSRTPLASKGSSIVRK
jgi:hypothetical protein